MVVLLNTTLRHSLTSHQHSNLHQACTQTQSIGRCQHISQVSVTRWPKVQLPNKIVVIPITPDSLSNQYTQCLCCGPLCAPLVITLLSSQPQRQRVKLVSINTELKQEKDKTADHLGKSALSLKEDREEEHGKEQCQSLLLTKHHYLQQVAQPIGIHFWQE